MYQTGKVLFLYCETPMHAGSGEGGIIDLPIQREGHTEFPKIEGSSLKGAIRETMRSALKTNDKNPEIIAAFGPVDAQEATRGALAFTDARLLLFPVRSAKGLFVWVTCPWALRQLQKDIDLIPGASPLLLNGMLKNMGDNEALVPTSGCPLVSNDEIMLEEYVFTATPKDALLGSNKQPIGEWLADHILPSKAKNFWKNALKENVVIIPDEAFRDFAKLHTEIITRNAIDPETGTVKDTGLFTEEYLPCDSVIYSVVSASPEFKKNGGGMDADDIIKIFEKLPEVVQIGGNATIGKGLVRATHHSFSTQPSPPKLITNGAEKS